MGSVLSGCFVYSIIFSGCVALGLYLGAPFFAENWVGDIRTVQPIRVYAGFLPVYCLCGVMTGYFTAANRIGTLAAVEVAEQFLSMAITMSLLVFWAGKNPVRACQAIIIGNGASICLTLFCLVVSSLGNPPPPSP